MKPPLTFYLLFAVFLFGFKLPAYSQDKNFRIITWNVYEGMKLDTTPYKTAFAQWIKEKDPDVMAFQEMNRFTQKSLEEFAQSYGHAYSVLLKETGFPVALTSKYPISNTKKVTDKMHHGYMQATVEGITFFVVHLSPHKYQKRQEEINIVLAAADSVPDKRKTIILGDFNSQSPQDSMFYADGKMVEVQKILKAKYPEYDNLRNGQLDYNVVGTALSKKYIDPVFNSKKLNISFSADIQGDPDLKYNKTRMDYILLKDFFKRRIEKAFIFRDKFTDIVSDHYPVCVELKY
jgi:exodeoxyribonuclease-3